MLERIGTECYITISRKNETSTRICKDILASGINYPVIAEIGVGLGATTLAMAEILDNRGEIHIYDFQDVVEQLEHDLGARGYKNIIIHGSTKKHWDSYNWNLAKKILNGAKSVYDYIYLDGAHTLFTDGLCFFLCDRLLKPGGYLEIDDYDWTFAQSGWMKSVRHDFMTEEQIGTRQVSMIIDLFLADNDGYETLVANRLFRKNP